MVPQTIVKIDRFKTIIMGVRCVKHEGEVLAPRFCEANLKIFNFDH